MLDDSLLVQVKEGAMQARDALEAQRDYHRDVDGTNDDDEIYYDEQLRRYQALIDAINAMFTPAIE
jgi:hypothetical protein